MRVCARARAHESVRVRIMQSVQNKNERCQQITRGGKECGLPVEQKEPLAAFLYSKHVDHVQAARMLHCITLYSTSQTQTNRQDGRRIYFTIGLYSLTVTLHFETGGFPASFFCAVFGPGDATS